MATKKYNRAQIRRMLKNPGERHKLADRYLPAEMLARRRANAAKAKRPPVDPFRAEAEAATRTEFDPQEEDIAKAERGSDQSRANLDAWFQQYLDQQKDIQARSAGAYTQAQGTVTGLDDKLAAQDKQGAGALAAGGQMLGNQLGLPGGADVLAAGTAQKASLARQALNDSFAARLASESVTQGNFLRDRESTVGRQRVDELGKEQSRRSELGTQRSKLGQKKRDYLSKYLADSKAAAQKQALEAKVIGDKAAYNAATLKLKQAQDAQDAADKAAARGVTVRGQDLTAAGRDADRAARGKGKGGKKGKPTGGPGSLTTLGENAIVKNIDNALGQARALQKAGNKTEDIFATLRSGAPGSAKDQLPAIPKFDSYAVNVAMDLLLRKGLSPANVKRLHEMGVHVGGRYKRLSTKKVVGKKLPKGAVKF